MPLYSVAKYIKLVDELCSRGRDSVRGRMNDYSFTEKDMLVALSLFHIHRPKRVLEFGVQEGCTAAFLLEHCDFIELYIGVDLDPVRFGHRGIVPRIAGERALGDRRFNTILTDETMEDFQAKTQTFLRMHSHSEGRRAHDERLVDCVIVDADHEYDTARTHTEACDLFLRPGGLWLWHDYNVDARPVALGRVFSIKRYLDELEASGRQIMFPADENRDPWKCCSLAWEIKQ